MSRRHGALVTNVNHPQCRLGIWKVFDPWVDPRLQALQDHTTPTITRPLTIEFHFRRVVHRLVRSLGRLYQRAREWDRFLEAEGLASTHPELAFEIPEEAGIAADSVFHYLNLFIDDLARVIPFVLAGHGVQPQEPNGFTALKNMVVKGKLPASQTLINLFSELDRNTSWWSLGFKRGVGMRQRLTHYTDLVIFHGKTKPGDIKMSGDVFLTTVGGPVHTSDFENGLEKLFTDFCGWLDRLEQELLTHLSARLTSQGVSWNPFGEPIPAVTLPELSDTGLVTSHYLYLPVCSQP
jgi:hypothetical protein